jgi:hydrogenase maturation protein HypF
VRIKESDGLNRVALSGGVFQNVYLLSTLSTELAALGFDVYRHSLVPNNDGCVALGQAVIAARRAAAEGSDGRRHESAVVSAERS